MFDLIWTVPPSWITAHLCWMSPSPPDVVRLKVGFIPAPTGCLFLTPSPRQPCPFAVSRFLLTSRPFWDGPPAWTLNAASFGPVLSVPLSKYV